MNPVLDRQRLRLMASMVARGGMRQRGQAEGVGNAWTEHEDMIQEGALAGWLAQKRFSKTGGASVETFAAARAYGAMLDWRRSAAAAPTAARALMVAGVEPEGQKLPEEVAEEKQRSKAVRAALEILTGREREIIISYYFGGMRHEDLANLYEISVSRTYQFKKQAEKKIRAALLRNHSFAPRSPGRDQGAKGCQRPGMTG